MRTKSALKMLVATLIIASLSVFSVNAAQEEVVDWGDSNYQIVVPGFIEGRNVTVDDVTIHAIVVEKPVKKSNGMYDFFEIVTTDSNAVTVTSSVGTMDDDLGDFMGDLKNGRIMYSPTLYADFEEISDQPLYLGFSFRDEDFNIIYEFPVWFVFEEGETTTPDQTLAPTSAPVEEVTAQLASSKVIVDNQQVSFEAYTIDGYNYFKLRDLAMAVSGSEKQFEVTWDSERKAINLVSKEAYTPIGDELTAGTGAASVKGIANQSKIYVDGEEIELEAYTINGNNYFKLRDVASVFDFGVTWDGAQNQIVIDTAAGYTE